MSEELAVLEQQPASSQLAPLANPQAFVAGYVRMADELARVITSKKLAVKISGRDHVRVEGWTMLGSMLGVFAATVWTHPLADIDGERIGWEARVEARTRDGALVGAAEAECLRSETLWASRDDYALRSMAQTRATSKALRQPLGFVMSLAGFDPTPAEEMPRDKPDNSADPMITVAQRARLHAVKTNHNVTDEEVKRLVLELTGQESTKFVPKAKYDELIAQIEALSVPFT